MQIRAQSAMEYLMTYGWAILIIAIVLGALFELGVFSGTFFLPKVPPGSCHVYRPYGPGSPLSVSLEGTCNGALPQYTLTLAGTSSVLKISDMMQEEGTKSVTYTIWVKARNLSGTYHVLFGDTYGDNNDGTNYNRNGYDIYIAGNQISYLPQGYIAVERYGNQPGDVHPYTNGTVVASLNPASLNQWYFVAVTYSRPYLKLYIDGVYQGETSGTFPITVNSRMELGAFNSIYSGEYFQGAFQVSNFQAYNSSLSSNQILFMYDEGIGGAPLDLQNLVGWWPLNGNLNDYSGNNHTSYSANAIYTNSWEGGYNLP